MRVIKKIVSTISLFIVLIVLYFATSLSPALIFDYERAPALKFKKTGHRGAAGLAPENTLRAVAKGLENKVDRIEIDVQQSKDEKVILMHDISLERTTDGKGLVKEFTYSQLLTLDAGSWFGAEFQKEKIPTLEDAIQLINGQSELIIEIKKGDDYYPNIEENILKIIEENNCSSWCIIHTFDTSVLERIHNLAPSIRLHKLFVGKFNLLPIMIGDGIEIFDIADYPYIEEYSINYYFANKETIKHIKSNGKKVNVWTANNQEIIDDMISLGVDGIITDFPDRIN